MIDAAAERGQGGTVLVLSGTGFQTPAFDRMPAAHLFHSLSRPPAYRPGFHRADDRSRGAVPDVSPDDRALVDRFLDMMAAEAGLLAAHASRVSQRSGAYGRRLGNLAMPRPPISHVWATVGGICAIDCCEAFRGVRRFFGFLIDDGLRKDDPSEALPRPRLERPLPRILEPEEVERMFEAAEDRAASGELTSGSQPRSTGIPLRVWFQGDRARQHASRGSPSHQPFLMIRGKGSKDRLVPISSRAEAAVARFTDLSPGGWCWLFPSGKTHLSRVRLSRSFGRWGPMRVSRRSASAPMCFAMRSPLTSFRRRRPSRPPVAAWSCGYRDDPDLHPCRQRPAGRAGQRQASAGYAFSLTLAALPPRRRPE